MNSIELQKKLLAVARATPPADAVPYGFEKRVMAILQSLPVEDAILYWGRILWRGAIASIAAAVICGAWASFHSANSAELSQDLEQTITASFDEGSSW